MIGSSHLTSSNPQLETLARATAPGQASWAIGPQTCHECAAWTNCGRSTRGRVLKPRACEQYRCLTGKVGPAVPYDTPACRLFQPNAAPPAISERRY
jgi:hypothetical protein